MRINKNTTYCTYDKNNKIILLMLPNSFEIVYGKEEGWAVVDEKTNIIAELTIFCRPNKDKSTR